MFEDKQQRWECMALLLDKLNLYFLSGTNNGGALRGHLDAENWDGPSDELLAELDRRLSSLSTGEKTVVRFARWCWSGSKHDSPLCGELVELDAKWRALCGDLFAAIVSPDRGAVSAWLRRHS